MSTNTSVSKKQKKSGKKKRTLTICTTYCHFDVVRDIAKTIGLKEVKETEPWNIFWTDSSISMARAKELKRFQRINHFPGMSEICRKDLLARNLGRLKKLFPKEYNFFPRTWILPADYGELYESNRRKRLKFFILKPFLSSQGRGIFMTRGLNDLRPYDRMICQVYVKKPFLIDGFKFDLRVYVLVTSCVPLRIFVYNDGLVRLATKKYSKPSIHNISNVYMHLTNYAVNRFSRAYLDDEDCGSKRKISTLNNWLIDNNYDTENLWQQIDDIIIKTILCAYPSLKHNYFACFSSLSPHQACFELLGFDILLDHKLKPYLLEVNHSPSFSTKTKVDQDVKNQLLLDTFSMLNLDSLDKWKIMQEDKQLCKGRLLQGITKKDEKDFLEQKVHQNIKAQEKWEAEHIGNFRLIYSSGYSSKYDCYFEDNVCSTYQKTIASRTREEAVRRNLSQVKEQARLEEEKRPTTVNKTMNPVEGKENIISKSKIDASTQVEKKPSQPKESLVEMKERMNKPKYILNSFEPQSMESEQEEKLRLKIIKERDLQIMRTGLVKEVYFSMKQNKLLSHSDIMKYSHLEKEPQYASTR